MGYIPKIIHLTCPDKHNIDNPIWKKCLEEYKSMYSDYEIIIYDDNDIFNIIEEHFPNYFEKIKRIKKGAVLADLFRYLILYIKGGIYSDLDCFPIKRIDELLNPNFKYYHGTNENIYFIYSNKQKIINNEWDFYYNICNNCKKISQKNQNYPIKMQCLGHSLQDFSTILGYEFHSDYHPSDLVNDNKWCYKNVGICQWFIITEPKQDIFAKIFNNILRNLDNILDGLAIIDNAEINNESDISREDIQKLHSNVIKTTGPTAFTKVVMDNLNDKIKILPCDFFCSGSGDMPGFSEPVPLTKNSYIKHLFTASWLPENPSRAAQKVEHKTKEINELLKKYPK